MKYTWARDWLATRAEGDNEVYVVPLVAGGLYPALSAGQEVVERVASESDGCGVCEGTEKRQMDTHTERPIQGALEDLLKGRTSFDSPPTEHHP
jgi:hypothetical protein